ncbi:putative dehydrogenase [Arthrobacter pascens]|nr:putative dehydrogenase [Arthrobacter pascens]
MKEFVQETIRWGILGPGNIARRFAKQLPSSQTGKLVAIGSSDRTRLNEASWLDLRNGQNSF